MPLTLFQIFPLDCAWVGSAARLPEEPDVEPITGIRFREVETCSHRWGRYTICERLDVAGWGAAPFFIRDADGRQVYQAASLEAARDWLSLPEAVE